MTVNLRDLLPRVMLMRPDLEDAKGMFALADAAKKLAHNGWLLRKTLLPLPMRNAKTFDIGEGELVRIEDMKSYKIPDFCRYAGEWDASTNIPMLSISTETDTGTDSVSRKTQPTANNVCDFSAYGYMGDGKILVSFLPTSTQSDVNSVTPFYIYNTKTDSWSGPYNVPGYRYGVLGYINTSPILRRMLALPDGRVWVAGSTSTSNAANVYPHEYTSWFIDRSGNVTPGPALPPTERWTVHTKTVPLSDGGILLMTQDESTAATKNAVCNFYKLDAAGVNLTKIASFTADTYEHHPYFSIPIPLGADRFLLYPIGVQSAGVTVNNKCVVFDARTKRVTTISQPTSNRIVRASWGNGLCVGGASIGNGIAIVTGGSLFSTGSRNVDKYDFNTNTWTTISAIDYPLTPGTGVLAYPIVHPMRANTVLITGDTVSGASSGVKNGNIYCIYDYSNGSFSFVNDGQTSGNSQYSSKFGAVSTGRGVYASVFQSSGTLKNFEEFSIYLTGNKGNWYSVSNDGLTDLDGNDQWEKNDVVYSDGEKWVQVKWTKAQNMYQSNQPVKWFNHGAPDEESGFPRTWTQDNGTVIYGPTPAFGTEYPVRATVYYAPSGNDIETVDLPADAQEVITDGALAFLLKIPGAEQDKNLAMVHDAKFNVGLSRMRATALFGYGGTPSYNAPCFGGTGNTFAVTW